MTFQSSRHKAAVNQRTDQQAASLLGTSDFKTTGVPHRLDETEKPITWEPEFGPTLTSLNGLYGAQTKLATIPNFRIFPKLYRDFSYVSASLNAPEGLIGRARFNYYKENPHNKRSISHPFRTVSGAKIGFKSSIKSPFRQECEAHLNENLDIAQSLAKLRAEHTETLPTSLQHIQAEDIHMEGLMCVQRAGFEATHLLTDGQDKFLISYAGSYDVGTCHDIRLSGVPSIIANHFETELEVTNVRSKTPISKEIQIQVIKASMNEISAQVETLFAQDAIQPEDPIYSMGKNSRATYEQRKHASEEEIRKLNIKPESLITREGQQGLMEIFDHKRSPLMAPEQIHFIAQMTHKQVDMALASGMR